VRLGCSRQTKAPAWQRRDAQSSEARIDLLQWSCLAACFARASRSGLCDLRQFSTLQPSCLRLRPIPPMARWQARGIACVSGDCESLSGDARKTGPREGPGFRELPAWGPATSSRGEHAAYQRFWEDTPGTTARWDYAKHMLCGQR